VAVLPLQHLNFIELLKFLKLLKLTKLIKFIKLLHLLKLIKLIKLKLVDSQTFESESSGLSSVFKASEAMADHPLLRLPTRISASV